MHKNRKQHINLIKWFYFNIGISALPYLVDMPVEKKTLKFILKMIWEKNLLLEKICKFKM